jgi:hypothetical protein
MNQIDVRERETAVTSQTDDHLRPVRITFLVTLVLLVIKYVLGMIANLELQFPAGNLWRWVIQNSLLIQLHIYNGTLLIVVALVQGVSLFQYCTSRVRFSPFVRVGPGSEPFSCRRV